MDNGGGLMYLLLRFIIQGKQGGASVVAQMVKNLRTMQKTLVRFLGQEDLLEKEQATHSSILGLSQWLRR